MGWTAAASIIEKDAWGPGKDDIAALPATHPAIADFKAAVARLRGQGHSSDCTLDIGLLCTRATGAALFEAVGQPMRHSGEKSSAEVKAMVASANWTLSSDKYEESNKATARAFLKVCAKHDLCVSFG
jgi:hypothetical protein